MSVAQKFDVKTYQLDVRITVLNSEIRKTYMCNNIRILLLKNIKIKPIS